MNGHIWHGGRALQVSLVHGPKIYLGHVQTVMSEINNPNPFHWGGGGGVNMHYIIDVFIIIIIFGVMVQFHVPLCNWISPSCLPFRGVR